MTESLYSQETKPIQIPFNQNKYHLYPETVDKLSEIKKLEFDNVDFKKNIVRVNENQIKYDGRIN